jgi:hypothetical protein
MAVGVAHAPAVVDPYIAAFAPAQFLQRLQERDPTGPRFRIVLGQVHEHTDAPHPLDRLRARRERPRRRTAEQRDERAPLQLIELHFGPPPARAGLQNIELAIVSQRVSGRLHNLASC